MGPSEDKVFEEDKYDLGLRVITEDSLLCIEKVGSLAEEASRSYQGPTANVMAAGNSLNIPALVNNFAQIGASAALDLKVVSHKPVLARVTVQYKEGKQETYFFARRTYQSAGWRISSLNTPLGSLASQSADDEFQLPSGEWVRVVDRILLHPEKPKNVGEKWDSTQNECESIEFTICTIASLRSYLYPHEVPETVGEDILEKLLADDRRKTSVISGIRRGLVTSMSLRDRPILDKTQDEIFRLPLNSKLFLAGPPGTGKTTTLIRRLSQKLNLKTLTDKEKVLERFRRFLDRRKHPNSLILPQSHVREWNLFAPVLL